MPTSKVAAGAGAGAATVVLVFLANLLGLSLTPEVASALTVLLSFGAAWLKTERKAAPSA